MSESFRFRDWLGIKGRAGRREYALVATPAVAFLATIAAISETFWPNGMPGSWPLLFVAVFMSAMWLVAISVGRRLHDIGHSVFWLAGLSIILRLTEDLHDRLEPGVGQILARAVPIAGIVLALLWLGWKPGQPEANEFGPPPS